MSRIVWCWDCKGYHSHYANDLCKACYSYQDRTGKPREYRRNEPIYKKHCIICLELFKPKDHIARFCSMDCKLLHDHYQCYRGRELECQRCKRVRKIRSKKLCAPCYSYVRQLVNKAGIYGQCSSQVRRLGKV